MSPQLVQPHAKYKRSFIQALEEYQKELKETGNKRLEHYKALNHEELKKDFRGFVQKLKEQTLGKGLPKGYVPCSVFWLVRNNTFLGWVDIRHRLTPSLLELGGHIGYDIRPSQRGKGYGTLMLSLAIKKARKLGIKNVLITCHVRNLASKKVIEANGGKLEDVKNTAGGVQTMRYWIKRTVSSQNHPEKTRAESA